MHVLLLENSTHSRGVSRSTWLAACDFLDAGHSIDVITNAEAMEYGFRQMTMEADDEIEVFQQRGGTP